MIASWRAFVAASAIVLGIVCSIQAVEQAASDKASVTPSAKTEYVAISSPDGKELFHREWIPNDPRAHGGDGLGPVFNESSCVSCHNQGGSGGGGVKDVDLITAFANPVPQVQVQQQMPQQPTLISPPSLPAALLSAVVESLTQRPSAQAQAILPPPVTLAPRNLDMPRPTPEAMSAEAKQALVKQQRKELEKIHPGFITARSVVLHRFSTNDKYEPWRLQMMGMPGNVFMNTVSINNAQIEDSIAFAAPAQAAELQPSVAAAPVVHTVGAGTLTISGSTIVASATAVNLQPMPTPAADVRINVVNETGSADQRIQSLRNVTQLAHAQGLQGQVGNFAFLHSRRNATSLFGAGLIDRIPDSVLIEQAKQTYKDFPEIQGRVAKMKGDKIGRFGWKAQKANLYEFSMTACAVELGLDVPDHPQAGMPLDAAYKSKAHDMDQPECDSLVAYLRNLPAPVQSKPASAEEAKYVSAGEKHFAAVGCANCHASKLGDVAGIYSDLLLHDMGQDLGDTGSYGVFVPNTPEEDDSEPVPSLTQQHQFNFNGNGAVATAEAKAAREKTIGALRQEWRTPPLWGVRDSAPYLHDGRASTLDEAIALHGGEAANSAKKFFMLKSEERLQVMAFMKSLTAPEQTASAE